NPFLAHELIRTLASENLAADASAVGRVRHLSPDAVSRSVLARLASQPDEARRLAVALAVLDLDATVARGAQLAGIDQQSAGRALERLVNAYICDPAEPTPRFLHPVIRTVIYEQVATSVRAQMHGHAAEVLDGEGMRDRAVAHLLVSSPAGSTWVVDRLV